MSTTKKTEDHFKEKEAPDFLQADDVPGGLTDSAPAAPAASQAVAAPLAAPQGFENLTADDLMMPRIKAYHPMSRTEVEGAKIGDWYEVNEAKKLGNKIEFMLLGKKKVEYDNEDPSSGLMVKKVYTHLLVAMLDRPEVPSEVILSVTGWTPSRKLMTSLMLKSKEKGNAPSFAFVVEAKLIPTDGEKGKYAVPEFSISRDATDEELEAAAALHTTAAGSFHSGMSNE